MIIERGLIDNIAKTARHLVKFPSNDIHIGYDEEADVLYISFGKSQKATDSFETEDGIIVRTKGRKIVGVTVIDASKR